MREFFNFDGPLFSFLNKAADFAILNLLFIVCSIPVVTLGASLSAMQYVCIKMQDKEEGYVWRTFLKAFRDNVKKATVIWLVMLVMLIVIGTDFWFVQMMSGAAAQASRVLVMLGAFIWIMIFLYVFPLQARFENTVMRTFTNALFLAIANIPRTLLMIVILIAVFVATGWNAYTLSYGLLFWLLAGFAVLCRIFTQIRTGAFRRIMPDENRDAQEEEEE